MSSISLTGSSQRQLQRPGQWLPWQRPKRRGRWPLGPPPPGQWLLGQQGVWFQLLVPRACCCFFARSSARSSFRPGWRHSLRSRGASGNHCLALRKQHLCPLDASRTFIYFTISCRFIQAMLKACQDHMKSSVDPLRNCWEKCCGGLCLHRASAKRIEMNPETGIGDQELHMAHGCTKITSLLMRLPPNLQASSLATDVCIGLFDLSLCMCEHKKSSVPWKVSQAIRFHELLGFCDF